MSMIHPSTATAAAKDVRASLNYIGDIVGEARFDVRDVDREKFENSNICWNAHDVTIHDARPHLDSLKIDETGFMFIRHISQVAEDPAIFDRTANDHIMINSGVVADYEQEFCDFLQDLSGAREVFPLVGGTLTRRSLRAEDKGWAAPGAIVHLDYSARAAPQFLRQTLEAQGRTLAPFSRYILYQTWRAVSPGPQDNTLAICDGRSVPASDCVDVHSIIGPEDIPTNVFESRMSRYNPAHRWYYLSDMEPEDVLVFKGFDSDIPEAMNAMHSAFDNPLGEGGVPRRSIESRFYAIFD